jgi:hypothetical protein
MKNLGIFYDNLVYFTSIGNILWPFGIFCGHLEHLSPFLYFVLRQIWQPCSDGSNLDNCHLLDLALILRIMMDLLKFHLCYLVHYILG